jgi:hypothetical protein
VALGWLWTPESMPSICLVYGSVVALGGFLPYQERANSRRDGADARRNPHGGEFFNRCSSVSYLPWLRHGCAAVATRTDPRAAGVVEMGHTTISPWSGVLKCCRFCVHFRRPCPSILRGLAMVVESLPFAVDEERLPPGQRPTRTAPGAASASRPALFLTRTETYASAKTPKRR